MGSPAFLDVLYELHCVVGCVCVCVCVSVLHVSMCHVTLCVGLYVYPCAHVKVSGCIPVKLLPPQTGPRVTLDVITRVLSASLDSATAALYMQMRAIVRTALN